jgi:L-threonylcarbamoyladenylate synthase
MKFLQVNSESLILASEVLRSGGLVAFPTETVYGLGADAFNSAALVKIFEAKGRPRFDPLIIHIADLKTLDDVANLSLLSEERRRMLFLLAENLWPGPLSIILPKNDRIPGIATAGLSTAAIRFPDHEAAQKLISLSGGAIAAPSANPFGALSPTRAEHVRESLGDKVDIILDGGPTRIGLESTVLDLTGDCFKILRPGGTPKAAIVKILDNVLDSQKISHGDTENTETRRTKEGLTSPGQMKSPYAPRTPLFVFEREEIIKRPYEKDTAYLFFDGVTKDAWLKEQSNALWETQNAVIKVLSEAGLVQEAAACLFETLHELDKSGCSRIIAQFAPDEGIGAAINDRLRRAGAG